MFVYNIVITCYWSDLHYCTVYKMINRCKDFSKESCFVSDKIWNLMITGIEEQFISEQQVILKLKLEWIMNGLLIWKWQECLRKMANVIGAVTTVTSNFLEINQVSIDNWTFKLFYKFTTVYLVTSSVLSTAKQFFGSPIQCDAGSVSTYV